MGGQKYWRPDPDFITRFNALHKAIRKPARSEEAWAALGIQNQTDWSDLRSDPLARRKKAQASTPVADRIVGALYTDTGQLDIKSEVWTQRRVERVHLGDMLHTRYCSNEELKFYTRLDRPTDVEPAATLGGGDGNILWQMAQLRIAWADTNAPPGGERGLLVKLKFKSVTERWPGGDVDLSYDPHRARLTVDLKTGSLTTISDRWVITRSEKDDCPLLVLRDDMAPLERPCFTLDVDERGAALKGTYGEFVLGSAVNADIEGTRAYLSFPRAGIKVNLDQDILAKLQVEDTDRGRNEFENRALDQFVKIRALSDCPYEGGHYRVSSLDPGIDRA